MHLIRFLAAVFLVELVVLAGVALERQQLAARARLSSKLEQIDQAKQHRAKHLLRIGQLSSAPRIVEEIEEQSEAGGNRRPAR